MSEILRPGLLDGVGVVLQRLGRPNADLAGPLTGLGASVRGPGDAEGQPVRAGALVIDCSGWVPADEEPGQGAGDPLLDLLDEVWTAVLGAAVEEFIPARSGGCILFIAPIDGGRLGCAAAAALENLSRSLSVEWARHSITAVTLVPGPGGDSEQLPTVVGYLLSKAGAYFSGTRLELGGLSR